MDPHKKRIRRVMRLAEAAVPLRAPGHPGPGRGHTLPRTHKVQSGDRSQYLANRIARDRPDILARMKAGEFESVRAAAIEAGMLKAKPVCPDPGLSKSDRPQSRPGLSRRSRTGKETKIMDEITAANVIRWYKSLEAQLEAFIKVVPPQGANLGTSSLQTC